MAGGELRAGLLAATVIAFACWAAPASAAVGPCLPGGSPNGPLCTFWLEQLLRRGRWRVRLAAQDPRSRSGVRLRRQVSTRIGGR